MAGAPKSPDSLQLRGSPLASARLSKKAALFTVGAVPTSRTSSQC